MKRLAVSEIRIYPVKSLGGIRLKSARVFSKGMEHDRRWMLIDDDNRFMTQRVYPQLALFKLSYQSGKFSIIHSNKTIDLPFNVSDEPITAQIWNDTVEVYEISKEHSQWFSDLLRVNCRLVSFPETNPRPVDPLYSINHDQVGLADAYPLLIIGQNSLDDLNSRMQHPLPMNRFRPNIVFTGGDPYEEDNWKKFSAGKNRFACVKPCSRCVTTTVDQDTGIKGIEPLVTLAAYRMRDNKVYFGQNLIPLHCDVINEGDEIVPEM